MEIQAENLKLVLESTDEVIKRIEAMSPAEMAEVSPDWLARVRASTAADPASTAADPWTHMFAMVERSSGSVIGGCGYKGPPGPDRIVEVAYGVDPNYQGRGYATEAARALVAHALGTGLVSLVRAHTPPGPGASTRVLAKCGFELVGEVVDPEDGLVWRWEVKEDAA